MLVSDYLGLSDELDEKGVFDLVLEEDSPFFINMQRLKKTTVPEFVESYEKIHEYFRKIIKLLDKAKKCDKSDIFFKQAVKLFDFSEVNGLCLGYAKGARGAGFGNKIGSQVMLTAYDIVKAGIEDPEFFELLPLFQENVAADRLSDMIATLILEDIKNYTMRIMFELGINEEKYPKLSFQDGMLRNPYKNAEVLFVPVEILHKLPIAKCWEEINDVVTENSIIRAEMNIEVASEWGKYSAAKKKSYMKRMIFEDSDVCKRVIDGYRNEELDEIDPCIELRYLIQKLEKKIRLLPIDWSTNSSDIDSYTGAIEIMEKFRQWVEYNKGWEVIQAIDSNKREKILQRIIHLAGTIFIDSNNLDMSCEPDEGRGPVDFKVSRGKDLSIIEVKLSSNDQYLHGYEKQIEEYGKAEKTDRLVYVYVDLGDHPRRLAKLQKLHDERIKNGERTPELIVINSKSKESASKY